MSFERFHQNRIDQKTRDQRAEVGIKASQFCVPLFCVPGHRILQPILGLRGTAHVSSDRVVEAFAPFYEAGIRQVLLFGSPHANEKDELGQAAYSAQNIVSQAIIQLKDSYEDLTIVTDICLCAYTSHGHCGLLDGEGKIKNDETIGLLAKMALAHARSGADIVAPSAMMDGQVWAIRRALDDEGHHEVKVMGYSAKFASSKYGPFRGAQDSSPKQGDRKTYQMDYRNGSEALAEIRADIKEGALIVMVKPSLTYLDIVALSKREHAQIPHAVYHTSGEFMATYEAAKKGIFDYKSALVEDLISCLRAGADILISYAAADVLDLVLPWENL